MLNRAAIAAEAATGYERLRRDREAGSEPAGPDAIIFAVVSQDGK